MAVALRSFRSRDSNQRPRFIRCWRRSSPMRRSLSGNDDCVADNFSFSNACSVSGSEPSPLLCFFSLADADDCPLMMAQLSPYNWVVITQLKRPFTFLFQMLKIMTHCSLNRQAS